MVNIDGHSQATRSPFSCWVEAMRLRTLPVSVAGVLMAGAMGVCYGVFRVWPWTVCLLFAVLCQVASNFANEYFDYKDGLDRKGRVGPRRGVTEGDISPKAMLHAAITTLGVAAALGCTLIYWGGWWLVAIGVAIIIGALAYSAGPYPLSRHGWGEVAVIVFFGIVPVTLTFYVMGGTVCADVWVAALSVGLMAANVLIVNNYRDIDDDRAVGKRTLAVLMGRQSTTVLYLINGLAALGIMAAMWSDMSIWWTIVPIATAVVHVLLWKRMLLTRGRALNRLLGATSMLLFVYTLLFGVAQIISADRF